MLIPDATRSGPDLEHDDAAFGVVAHGVHEDGRQELDQLQVHARAVQLAPSSKKENMHGRVS